MIYKDYDTLVIGSGCAGLNAIDWLATMGRKNIALITEGMQKGTSRNTGSDKQTYYKLSLSSDQSDSVGEMAQTLYQHGGVNGDVALTEAACSVQCFMKLVQLGVDFPTNRYGEYVGYKTDHDPKKRGTSAGPLTSKYMTEALEKSVKKKKIPIHDHTTVIHIVVSEGRVAGLIALIREHTTHTLCYFRARHVIFCTGGPAICYADSVYPTSQTGMSGMLFDAGVFGSNLQDWQYGLSSIKFRWNVSGSYQQVLPRYISVDAEGVEREFLFDQGISPKAVLNKVFLKGYQWPFDVDKIGGSSDIDLWVYHETVTLGRRVFLDYRSNPSYVTADWSALSFESYEYLKKSKALLPTPIERLAAMNPLAITLYKKHNIDLYTEPLEIRVCAQHHNGGALVDSNWQTNIAELYIAGEAAGTFGAYRPGGSALNSAQVGSLRAAQHICCSSEEQLPVKHFAKDTLSSVEVEKLRRYEKLVVGLRKHMCAVPPQSPQTKPPRNGSQLTSLQELRRKFQTLMTAKAGHIRNKAGLQGLLDEIEETIPHFFQNLTIATEAELVKAFKVYDMLITQQAVLSAMLVSVDTFGSRGSCLVSEGNSESATNQRDELATLRIITKKESGSFYSYPEKVSPIPQEDNWFESVWAKHRQKRLP